MSQSHNHRFRFLSVILALAGTGNFIFSRVLLSDLAAVEHASASCDPIPPALFFHATFLSPVNSSIYYCIFLPALPQSWLRY